MTAPAPGAAPAPAGLARRFGALVYEGLIAAALVLVAGFALAPLMSPGSSPASGIAVPTTAGRIAGFALLVGLLGAFYVWSWGGGRRTLPMKTWRLVLVTSDGAPVPRRAALVRYLAWWVGPSLGLVALAWLRPHGLAVLSAPLFALNYLAAFVDPERQFLHDRVAGTRIGKA